MTAIKTKAQHQALYVSGRYGPIWPVWTLEQAASSASPFITVRDLRPDSPFCQYDVPTVTLRDWVASAVARGADQRTLYYQPFDPKQELSLLLQGEFDGLNLTYSRIKEPMRRALAKKTEHATGPHARLLLKGALDPTSYENLLTLTEDFPNHVIEFSCWNSPPPWIQPRNTVIWEVRSY